MNRKLRAALIIYGSLDTISGGYLYDRMLVKHLRETGWSVDIFSLPWRHYGAHLADNFNTALFPELFKTNYDIILQDELNHPSLIRLNRQLHHRNAAPIISIVHHLRSNEHRPAWQNTFYQKIENIYLNSVDGFIFNSRNTQQQVNALLKTPKPEIIALPAADHLPLSQKRHAKKPPELRLLFLGNVIPRKGLCALIEALSRLPKQHWQLTIAGKTSSNPAFMKKLQHKISRLALDDRIAFTGYIPSEKLADLYLANDLFVMPSFFEGFGIVYLEAMQHSLPVIASAGGGASAIVHHGKNGFLVPPRNIDLLEKYIRMLLYNRELLTEMKKVARKTFEAHPTWEESMEKVDQFLRQCWADRKR